MAWGAPGSSGVGDLVERLSRDDPSLRTLALLRARRFGDPEALSLAAALVGNTALVELVAPGRELSPAAAAALAAALPRSRVASLSLGEPRTGDAAVAVLAPGCGGLVRLALPGAGLGAAAAAALSALLRRGGPLAALELDDNPGLGDAGVAELCASAASPGAARLGALSLVRCGLTAACGLPLGRLARAAPRLADLRLCDNPGLGPAGAAALAGALLAVAAAPHGAGGAADAAPPPPAAPAALHPLASLSLAGCASGDAGCAALGAALGAPGCGLVRLDLSRCQVGADGCAALARGAAAAAAAGSGARLAHLQLADNPAVGDGGAARLAAGGWGALASLGLAGCGLRGAPPPGAGDDGDEDEDAALSRCPLAALLSLPVLASLDLRGNALMGDGGARALARALPRAPPPPPSSSRRAPRAPLGELDVSGCGFGPGGGAALLSALADGAAPHLTALTAAQLPAAEAPPPPLPAGGGDGGDGGVEAEGGGVHPAWAAGLAALAAARPGLRVVWRAGGGGGGEGA